MRWKKVRREIIQILSLFKFVYAMPGMVPDMKLGIDRHLLNE